MLAIAQTLNPDFSGVEALGKVVISRISRNTGTNTIISLGVMIFEIYQKLKTCGKQVQKRTEKDSSVQSLRSTHQNLSNNRKNGYPRDSRPIWERKKENKKKISKADKLMNSPIQLKFQEVTLSKSRDHAARRRILRVDSTKS